MLHFIFKKIGVKQKIKNARMPLIFDFEYQLFFFKSLSYMAQFLSFNKVNCPENSKFRTHFWHAQSGMTIRVQNSGSASKKVTEVYFWLFIIYIITHLFIKILFEFIKCLHFLNMLLCLSRCNACNGRNSPSPTIVS